MSCVAAAPETQVVEGQGIAEVRVDASALADLPLTRVTVEAGGLAQDLVFNGATFNGTLMVPAGATTVSARAFSADEEIGASSAVPVVVQSGVVTRVMLRIVDRRGEAPVFGPIFDSLTFPSTAQAGTPVSLALSVIAPAGDPVSYQWSSDCVDASFGSATAATTTWVKPTQGACGITVVAVSNGFGVRREFTVVVFPAGTQNGALDVEGAFITTPRPDMSIDNGNCSAAFSGNSSCGVSFAAPSVVKVAVNVSSWGGSTPASISLSDNCGGKFATMSQDSDALSAVWLPPVAGGLCFITATAVNGDGGSGTRTAALLVRPGSPATSAPPSISGLVATASTPCGFSSESPGTQPSCGGGFAGSEVFVVAGAVTSDFLPVEITLSDDCGGGPPVTATRTSGSAFSRSWSLAGASGSTCTVTVRATSFQGVEAVAQAVIAIF